MRVNREVQSWIFLVGLQGLISNTSFANLNSPDSDMYRFCVKLRLTKVEGS